MVPGMKTKHGKSQRSLVVYCRFGLMIFKKKKKFAFAWGLDHHSCTYNFCCRMFVQNLNIFMKR